MSSALELLAQSCPAWFRVQSQQGAEILGTAIITVDGAAKDFQIPLRIGGTESGIRITEQEVGLNFPKSCAERHINDDGSFCVGYGADKSVVDADRAGLWWGYLKVFLGLQIACRTKMWPTRQALSHGIAGKYQQEAMKAAEELGILEDYYRMLDGEAAWFSSNLIQANPSGTQLTNGKSPCPMGCKRSNGNAISRRDCCKKHAVVALVVAERKRQHAEDAFWEGHRQSGAQCCGTMRNCPLATPSPQHPPK